MDAAVSRLIGGLLLLAAALFWNPSNPLWMATLTWLAFAIGAYLVTRAMLALFLTLALVTAVQLIVYDLPTSTTWIYGITTVVSSLACAWILIQRFRQRIVETREERWKNR